MVSVKDVSKISVNEAKNVSQFFYDALTFKKLRRVIDTQKEAENKRINRKVISYLRLYSHLNEAKHRWRSLKPHKGVHFLEIVKSFTNNCQFKEEEPYYEKINELVKSIISEAKEVEKPESPIKETSRVKIRLKMAENICMLRLLKVHEQ